MEVANCPYIESVLSHLQLVFTYGKGLALQVSWEQYKCNGNINTDSRII